MKNMHKKMKMRPPRTLKIKFGASEPLSGNLVGWCFVWTSVRAVWWRICTKTWICAHPAPSKTHLRQFIMLHLYFTCSCIFLFFMIVENTWQSYCYKCVDILIFHSQGQTNWIINKEDQNILSSHQSWLRIHFYTVQCIHFSTGHCRDTAFL